MNYNFTNSLNNADPKTIRLWKKLKPLKRKDAYDAHDLYFGNA